MSLASGVSRFMESSLMCFPPRRRSLAGGMAHEKDPACVVMQNRAWGRHLADNRPNLQPSPIAPACDPFGLCCVFIEAHHAEPLGWGRR